MKEFSLRIPLLIAIGLLGISTLWAQKKESKKAGASDPTTLMEAESRFTEGMKEYLLENYSQALKQFEESLKLQPASGATYYMIATIQVKNGNFYNAIKYAEKAKALDPTNKYYYLLLATIYDRKQDFNESAKVYLEMLKNVPNCYEYYYELAVIYITIGKREEGIKALDKYEKYMGVNEDITKMKIQQYLQLNKLSLAIKESEKLIEAFPDEDRHFIGLIEMLLSNDKISEAEKYTLTLLQKDPNNPYGSVALSDIYRAKGELDKANIQMQKAFSNPNLDVDIKIGILISKVRQYPSPDAKEQSLLLGEILVKTHPLESKAFAMYGDVLTLNSRSQEALEVYLRSVRLDASTYKVWQQIVMIDHELNLIDSIRIHSAKALELFPNQTIFWFYNGLSYQLLKDYKKAITAFEEGKKLASNDKEMIIRFNTLLGDSYNGLKDYKKSDASFDEVLKSDENNHIVLNNYSYYLSLRKERLDIAKKMSEKVIKEFPDNPTYLDTYAWILYVMKDYRNAKEIFEKIIKDTTSGTIVEHYGDVLFQLGEKELALEQWIRAKEMGETSELIDKKIRDKKLYE